MVWVWLDFTMSDLFSASYNFVGCNYSVCMTILTHVYILGTAGPITVKHYIFLLNLLVSFASYSYEYNPV